MSVEHWIVILLVLGLLPWKISRQTWSSAKRRPCQTLLEIRAIFWCLSIESPFLGTPSWRLTLPVIHRLESHLWKVVDTFAAKARVAVWAALQALLDKG